MFYDHIFRHQSVMETALEKPRHSNIFRCSMLLASFLLYGKPFLHFKWLHFGQNHPSSLQNPWLERAASWSNWQLEPTPCYFHLIRSQDTLLWYGSQDAPGHHLLGSWISLQDHVLPVSKPHGPKIFWYLIVLCKKSWESQFENLKNISI